VRKGLAREDLFTVVHDPFLTDTAKYADIVLPAASYLETDDLYRAYGAYWMQWGQQAAKPRGEARSNFDVAQALAQRMGSADRIFTLKPQDAARELFKGATGPAAAADKPHAVRRRADPHQARLAGPALRHALGQAGVLLRAARQAGPLAGARLELPIRSRSPTPRSGRCAS
jgi:anaerobic selenocysteine-containing dehydrogenase